jgi:hypothetical protein
MADRDDTQPPPYEPERQDDIVRRHLTLAWQSWAPSPDLDARVRARLTSSTAATLGALGLGAATSAGRPSPWASLQASGKLGVFVGAGLVGVGFLSGYIAHSSRGPSASSEQHAPVSTVVSVAAPKPDVALPDVAPIRVAPPLRIDAPQSDELIALRAAEPTEKSRERSPRSAPARPEARGPATPAPSEELVLLQRADRAVRADNAALALALIGELEASYPRSTLLEERSAIELLAHCSAGASDASSHATRFLRQHPSSLYAGRIRELCPAVSETSADRSADALTNPASPGHGSEQKEQP